MKLSEAFEEFLLACQADDRSQQTIEWYRNMLSRGPYNVITWMHTQGRDDIAAITTSDLRQYIVWMREQPNVRTGKPRSVRTHNATLRCLHRFFAWAAQEFEFKNPMQRIAYPKDPAPEPRAIQLETALALVQSCGNDFYGIRNRAMLMFFLSTGARREGVATLARARVNLAERQATVVEKGRKPRIVAFDDLTAQALADWLNISAHEQFVFYNPRSGQRLTGSGVRTIIRRLAERNGITGRTNPHGWRHLFAQLYYRAGGNLASLSKLLGHSSMSVTMDIYLNMAMESALQDYRQVNPMERLADELRKRRSDS